MPKQTIFRVEKTHDFVTMHKGFLGRDDLSLKAKGLLAYILSLPDNCHISLAEIEKHHKDGRDSIHTTVKELIAAGYIMRMGQERDDNQRLGHANYIVHEVPAVNGFSVDGFPVDGFSVDGFPVDGEPEATSEQFQSASEATLADNGATVQQSLNSPGKDLIQDLQPGFKNNTGFKEKDYVVECTLKTGSPKRERPKRSSFKVPAEVMTDLVDSYKRLKGIELHGDEHLPVQQAMKSMLRDGNTPEQIKSLMEALSSATVEWAQGWTYLTVRRKLPEWRAGKLRLSENGKRGNALSSGVDYSAIIENMMMRRKNTSDRTDAVASRDAATDGEGP